MPVDDDVYVNEGESYQNGIYYPEAPKERTASEQDQKAPTDGSLPIMPAVAKWFADQVASCGIDGIQMTKMTINGVTYSRTVSIEAQVLAMQLLKGMLTEKAHEFSKYMESPDA